MEAEVGIVGAGAAGGVLALALARRGIQVVVLESGPRHDVARRGESVRRYLRHENPWPTLPRELDRYAVGGTVLYQLEGRRARGVGGSTLHWEGYALRMHERDLRLLTSHGIAEDWPISYQDLEPYYTAAERMLGVAGAADEPWASPRSASFPLPAFAFSHSDSLFAGVCRTLGIGFHHLPQARNSLAYDGRPQCRACGTCQACPTGARASVDLAQIPQAEATGHARVVTEATVLRLELDPAGEVEALVYAGLDKVERRLTARIFVLAGHPRVRRAASRPGQLHLAQPERAGLLRQSGAPRPLQPEPLRAQRPERCPGRRRPDPKDAGTERHPPHRAVLRRPSDRHPPDGNGPAGQRGRRRLARPRRTQPLLGRQRLLRDRQRLAPHPHHRAAGNPCRGAHLGQPARRHPVRNDPSQR